MHTNMYIIFLMHIYAWRGNSLGIFSLDDCAIVKKSYLYILSHNFLTHTQIFIDILFIYSTLTFFLY